jgi:hypothetical protein
MHLTLGSGSTPPGSYLAKFVGIEPTAANEFGAGIRWQFEILSPPLSGTKIGRTTSDKPTLKNACGRMLTGISGKTTVGETVDLTQFVGKTYLIVVTLRPEGGTSLDSVCLPPTG